MSVRYNPHRIAREACRWPSTTTSRGSLEADVRDRALHCWNGREYWTATDEAALPVGPEIAAEYGYDAICIASLTSGGPAPGTALLESAWRWLSLVCDHSEAAVVDAPNERGGNEWDASPWLAAAFTARDHLVFRGHPYPALATIRKAWKQSPAGIAVPGAGLRLIWSLILPFAPLLARHFLERTRGWPASSLERLAEPFMPRQAVRVALERGGWNWVVVDADRFSTEPAGELAGIGWIAHALGGRPWTVRCEGEGWRVCPGRPSTTVVNF